jgi:hypothetical protein
VFEDTMIWPQSSEPIALSRLISGMEPADAAFVGGAYESAAFYYRAIPPRRNGEAAFTHPTNVAQYLVNAHAQPHVVACALLHDVVEDGAEVDPALAGTDLDTAQRLKREEMERRMTLAAAAVGFPRHLISRVFDVVWTLTRHKTDLYYKSISGIFHHHQPEVRYAATLVKLADRMHNIQTIENYLDDQKLYQCFKNLFILNNAKRLLSEIRHSGRVDPRMVATLAKMFKKSGKATFQALHRIDHQSGAADLIFPLLTYLALAAYKFSLEVNGLWRVTEGDLAPGAPAYNLFHGIVNKYDHRLHKEDSEFAARVELELDFCEHTFADLDLSRGDFMRAMFYKDAMALKEVVASLLYHDTYVISGFECSNLCRRGRDCRRSQTVEMCARPK